jgi:hypothetical protein
VNQYSIKTEERVVVVVVVEPQLELTEVTSLWPYSVIYETGQTKDKVQKSGIAWPQGSTIASSQLQRFSPPTLDASLPSQSITVSYLSTRMDSLDLWKELDFPLPRVPPASHGGTDFSNVNKTVPDYRHSAPTFPLLSSQSQRDSNLPASTAKDHKAIPETVPRTDPTQANPASSPTPTAPCTKSPQDTSANNRKPSEGRSAEQDP